MLNAKIKKVSSHQHHHGSAPWAVTNKCPFAMSSSKGILADDGTLDLSGEYREMNSPESSSLSSAPSSIMQLLRPRFHNGNLTILPVVSLYFIEMEALMKNYQVRIVDKDEFVDGQLVYRITLPLNPPQKEKWTSVDLDLWCYSEEETSTGYQLGYKISTVSNILYMNSYNF